MAHALGVNGGLEFLCLGYLRDKAKPTPSEPELGGIADANEKAIDHVRESLDKLQSLALIQALDRERERATGKD